MGLFDKIYESLTPKPPLGVATIGTTDLLQLPARDDLGITLRNSWVHFFGIYESPLTFFVGVAVRINENGKVRDLILSEERAALFVANLREQVANAGIVVRLPEI